MEGELTSRAGQMASVLADFFDVLPGLVWSQSGNFILAILGLYVGLTGVALALSLFSPVLPAKFGAFLERLSGQRSAKKLVREVLTELGYRESHFPDIVAANERQVSRLIGVTAESARLRLCRLLSRCARELPAAMYYGHETPERTEYYIDTIGAAVDRALAEEMANLMQFLLNQRQAGSKGIDFLLVPKSGNVLLGHTLARMWGYHCLFRKDDRSTSRARASDIDVDPNGAVVNLEGFETLLDAAGKAKRALYGVAIDCNCSGGSSIVRSVEEFNQVAATKDDRLLPMSEVFILYRPDRSELGTASHDGQQLNFCRYFDLTEAQKRSLATQRSENQLKHLARVATINGS